MSSRDGRGLVGKAAGVRAREGDGVDAIDSRGDVDGRVIAVALLGEGAHQKSEEEDDDLVEGAHLDVVLDGVKECEGG